MSSELTPTKVRLKGECGEVEVEMHPISYKTWKYEGEAKHTKNNSTTPMDEAIRAYKMLEALTNS